MQVSTYDALESMRLRLIQLTHSLSLFAAQLTSAGPGPTLGQIQAQLSVLQSQFHSLAAGLIAHEEVLSTTVIYPQPAFPARQEENLLLTLLRRKLTPQVETWMEEGASAPDKQQAHDELFQYALDTLRQKTVERKWDGELTMEERLAGHEPENQQEKLDDSAVIDQVLLFLSSGKR